MGSTVSKSSSKQDDWNAALSRSSSVPASSHRLESERSSKFSWKSRLSSMPRLDFGSKQFGRSNSRFSTLKSVREEALLERDEEGCGFLGYGREPNTGRECYEQKNLNRVATTGNLGRTVSFRLAHDVDPESKFSLSCRTFNEGKLKREDSGVVDSRFKSSERQTSSSAANLFCPKDFDMSIGLRLLLRPDLEPSQSFASPKRGTSFNRLASFNGVLDQRSDEKMNVPSTISDKPGVSLGSEFADDSTTSQLWMPGPDTESPLFDPSILATFEKAVEALSDDGWRTLDFSTSENVSSSSETSSDADSPKLLCSNAGDIGRSDCARILVDSKGDAAVQRAATLYNRKPPLSRVFSLYKDDREYGRQDYLEKFERRCPPGCENKIVLYYTSLRCIRKTFEDCRTLRLILKGLRVHVDERDVWMHSRFRKELADVMGVEGSVPRLFIMGRYIGGAEEVELLHEEGILKKLVDGFPTEWRPICDLCGDVRFIPCTTCSGSCKIMTQDDIMDRCPDCNENGLVMCPMCVW